MQFNVAEIAEKTNTKANTLQKRFSIIRKRYPDLNIRTTTTGSSSNGEPSSGTGSVPATPKALKKISTKTSTAKPKGRPAAEDGSEDDHDGDSNEDQGEDDGDGSDGAQVNAMPPPKAKPLTKSERTPATPATDAELADDEKSTKKQITKPAATKAKAKPKAQAKANANANTAAKRKRPTTDLDNDSSSPAPTVKKPRVTKTPRVTKKKSEAKVKSDDEDENEANELGKQESHQELSQKDMDGSVNANANTEVVNQVQDNADLALDVVQHYADKSHRGAITMASSTTPASTMARSGVGHEKPVASEKDKSHGEEECADTQAHSASGVHQEANPPAIDNAAAITVNEQADPPNRPDESLAQTSDADIGSDTDTPNPNSSEDGIQV